MVDASNEEQTGGTEVAGDGDAGAGDGGQATTNNETPAGSEVPAGSTAEAGEPTAEKPNWESIPDEDLQKLALERLGTKLLESDLISREIQSRKDREIAEYERKRRADESKQRELERRRLEEEEEQALLEAKDYQGLGERYAKTKTETKKAKEEAAKFNELVIAATHEIPEIADLGDERIQEIRNEIANKKGSVVDLQTALFRAAREKVVAQEVERNSSTLRDELKQEMEALRLELGGKTRSAEASDGEIPPASAAAAGSRPAAQGQLKWSEAADQYNAGDMSWEEYKPYKEAHDKEVNG